MGIIKSRWFQILVIGMVLWGLADVTLRITKNVLYFPTIMVIGAFLVPLAFVAFFFQHEGIVDKGRHQGSILPTLVMCALLGGLIGTLSAGLLEFKTLTAISYTNLIWVGPIEEFSKLIVPVAVYIIMRNRFRSEMDGLLFGVAVGMMFAALETMGYELIALVTSLGNLNVLNETILLRGLLSPAGHAAWTGLITATLWRERERTGKPLTVLTVVFFVISAGLHSAWDYAGINNSQAAVVLSYLALAAASLSILFWRFREARKARQGKP